MGISGMLNERRRLLEFRKLIANNSSYICEMGDLLTLFLMLDRNKNILHQRAFISQVKKENKLDNKCQQFLYEICSSFSYYRGACEYNGGYRKLPKVYYRHLGMNYLILGNHVSWYCPFIKFIPFNANVEFPWGISILLMLLKLYGLMFSKTEPVKGAGWSKIIWDLINCTGKATYRGQPRGNYLNMFLDRFNKYDSYENYFMQADNPEGGIPTLFIIIQDYEAGGQR